MKQLVNGESQPRTADITAVIAAIPLFTVEPLNHCACPPPSEVEAAPDVCLPLAQILNSPSGSK